LENPIDGVFAPYWQFHLPIYKHSRIISIVEWSVDGLGVAVAQNGMIYAIGGRTNSGGLINLATVEEYNPTTNTWATRTSMPTARTGLGVTLAPKRQDLCDRRLEQHQPCHC
jgi:hypothetical protein